MNIDEIKAKFSGQILMPGDSAYEAASTVVMGKGSPAIVFLPNNAEDVAQAILFAKNNSLILSVRSGGHGALVSGTNNGGAVINLSHMKAVTILDEPRHIVKVETGNTWIEVAQELNKHGLALSSGDSQSVGVGGLTLGGGIGWMVRKFGLTIDHIVGAEIVTADGQILQISESEHPDLFWAIRGGGGNFGVITSFTFKVHPMGKVFYGPIMYDPETLAEVIKGVRDYLRTAPNELTTIMNYIPANMMGNNLGMLILSCCVATADENRMKEIIEPLTKIGKMLSNGIALKDYPQALEEAHAPGPMKVVVNNFITNDFSDALIEEIVALKNEGKNMVLQIRALGGAVKDVPADATAFAHRNGEAMILSPAFMKSDATPEQIQEAQAPWQRLAPFGTGAYVQFFSEQNQQNTGLVYPKDTLEKLKQIKQKYDPQNLFSLNFNIR